jgi:acyl-CoA thioester hydrolase
MEPFAHRLRVRYADTDAQGVVFFANYLTFFDEAMTHYVEWLGIPWSRLEEEWGIDTVYVDARCQYRAPCRFPDELQIRAGVGRLGRSSVTLQFEIVTGDDPSPRAQGQLVVVCVGAGTHRSTPWPEPLRAAFERGEPPADAGPPPGGD